MKLSKVTKESGAAAAAATNVRQLSEATGALTAEQSELIKIQKQISTVQARNNEEYVKQVKALNDVKQAMKEKIARATKMQRQSMRPTRQ